MLDPQTLSDLNIASLRTKLDYCQTTGGKEYLDMLLKLQQIGYPEILERQRIIKFICGQAGRWKMPIGEEDVFYVKQYLGSTYVALEGGNRIGRMLSSLYRFAFHKEQYYFTLTGIKATLRLVQEIVLLCRTVYDPAMPRSLKEKLEGVQEAAAFLGIAEQGYTTFLHEEPNPMMVFNVDSRLRSQHRDTIADILKTYYQLETFYSLASAHMHMKLIFPELREKGQDIYLEGLTHPLVRHCSANSLHTNGKHMMIITGPNMSGKSTFMKSVGLAFVMAYLGIGVAAASAAIPVMDVIISCIDIKDDIEKGYSYFFSEVQRVRAIAEQIRTGKRVVVIGDELFKGTNVQDAVDCTSMVLQGFLKHERNFYFIATHFTTVAEQFEHEPGCLPICFDGKVVDGEIAFDYRLKPGISSLRIGSLILQQQQVINLLDPITATVMPALK